MCINVGRIQLSALLFTFSVQNNWCRGRLFLVTCIYNAWNSRLGYGLKRHLHNKHLQFLNGGFSLQTALLWAYNLSACVRWMIAWLCVQWKALYVSASQWIREVLWSILSVIQSCLWSFPLLLSRSRRWDHRTSLHRWQPEVEGCSRSRGAYRLLARCEILPCMLSCLCQFLYYQERWDVTVSHQRRKRRKACNLLFLPGYFLTKRDKCQPPSRFSFILSHMTIMNMHLYYLPSSWFPINALKLLQALWPVIYHSVRYHNVLLSSSSVLAWYSSNCLDMFILKVNWASECLLLYVYTFYNLCSNCN